MRILHVATNDLAGGAARAAYRLHQALRRQGHDSWMYVANRSSADPNVIAFTPTRSPFGRAQRALRRWQLQRELQPYVGQRPAGLEPFSDDRTIYGDDPIRHMPDCDIINLHWIAGFIEIAGLLRRATRSTPVVWTLADQNPYTGGCHYDEGCGRFATACGACPQLGSTETADLSARIAARKRVAVAAVAPGGLHIVALSRWIADEVRRSTVMAGVPVSVIPNSVDTDLFAPGDRAAARHALGIPAEARVLMFAADSLENRRKGFAKLTQALAGLDSSAQLLLLSLGEGKPSIGTAIPYLHLGHVDSDARLVAAYRAADLFVLPSLQDNLPNTALEALACGTPIVAFAAGGIPDMVRPGLTGLLAPVGDVEGLRDAIRTLLDEQAAREALRHTCRSVAVREYGAELHAQRYMQLYTQLRAGYNQASDMHAR
jgi:glycosyltransferase involved in cell wall biosynthesis